MHCRPSFRSENPGGRFSGGVFAPRTVQRPRALRMSAGAVGNSGDALETTK